MNTETMTAPRIEELSTILATARHHGLGLAGLQTLLLLARHGEQNMTSLAADLGVTTSAMTRTAQSLIAKSLIHRAHNHHADMRIVHLTLTELGRARIHQLTGTLL